MSYSLGIVDIMLGHMHTARMCRQVAELGKEGGDKEMTGWESMAFSALVDTHLTVFITKQPSTVHRAMCANGKSIVLSGKKKNEMHKLIFP